MRYYGDIYRAPSEAESLLLQITIGCSHNRCTFCYMYKNKSFRIRPLEEIREDIRQARAAYPSVRRVFLIDGDALVVPTAYLSELLDHINEVFPECERTGLSATAADILRKSPQELSMLRSKGLKIIYMGVESGSDAVLKMVCKGSDAAALAQAGVRVRDAGIALSVSVIAGLGGVQRSNEHALKTAEVLNAIQPDFVGLLSLLLHEDAPIRREVEAGTLTLLESRETLQEIRLLVEALELEATVFRANHASNYAPLKARLPEEKKRLLDEIDRLLLLRSPVRHEHMRRL